MALVHRLTTPSGREGGQDCDGSLSQAPIRSLPTRPDNIWKVLHDRADRSTQRHEVTRNKGQTRPNSTTIMLTIETRRHSSDEGSQLVALAVIEVVVRGVLGGFR